jgi:hypothetical protein
MTDVEKAEKLAEITKEAAKVIKDRKAAEIKAGFLNPFGEKTTYPEFLEDVKKSKVSVAEYCEGKISAEELAWLELELEHYNNNTKKD